MTKKEILKQVFDEISTLKSAEIFVAERNRASAMKNTDYADLESQKRLLNMQIGKLRFENKSSLNEETQLSQILVHQAEILNEIGLSKDDLSPKFTCDKCNDTGIFQNALCVCAQQKFMTKLMQNCNVNLDSIPYLKDYDCKFFDDDAEIAFAKKCVVTFEKYVKEIDDLQMKNIVMCGASGTGKTYLAKCLTKELIFAKHTSLFISSFDLNNMFLTEHLSAESEKSHLQDLIDLDVLVIDDLGTEPIRKNVTKEYLLILLNERLEQNKSTIITTNLLPDQVLSRYDERIFSRIFNKRNTLIMQFVGKNERLKRNFQ